MEGGRIERGLKGRVIVKRGGLGLGWGQARLQLEVHLVGGGLVAKLKDGPLAHGSTTHYLCESREGR